MSDSNSPSILNEIVQDIPEVAEAVEKTIAAPTLSNLFDDMQLAIRLAKRFKTLTATMHPDALDVLKKLL